CRFRRTECLTAEKCSNQDGSSDPLGTSESELCFAELMRVQSGGQKRASMSKPVNSSWWRSEPHNFLGKRAVRWCGPYCGEITPTWEGSLAGRRFAAARRGDHGAPSATQPVGQHQSSRERCD